MDLDEVEEQQMEHDHALNVKSLSYGFSKLAEMSNNVEKREPHKTHNNKIKLNLNVGAFIRKVIRNGANKHMSTYWSYEGSLTTPTCNEAVTWVVFERALPIAQVQVSYMILFERNVGKENKPVLNIYIYNCRQIFPFLG